MNADENNNYEYKLICKTTTNGLNKEVAELVKVGFRPMGSHTHQKSNYDDVVEQQTWNNMFCISMEKKSTK